MKKWFLDKEMETYMRLSKISVLSITQGCDIFNYGKFSKLGYKSGTNRPIDIRAGWEWGQSAKNWYFLLAHTFLHVFLKVRRGSFSWIFWFEDSFLCKIAVFRMTVL